MATDSPWLTITPAIDYLAEERTDTGRRKFGRRYIRNQVATGKLRAARVGGRGELLFRKEWLDQWIEDQATPVVLPARRRA
jgi:excisionase family DNA binding protein